MKQDAIYQKMKSRFLEETGETIADDGDLGMRMSIIAEEMAQIYEQIEFYTKQSFPQTATGVYLERHGQIRDIQRRKAAASVGVIQFQRKTAAAQNIAIPKGTICTSSAGGTVMYSTTQDGILAAGKTSVDIPAIANQMGKNTNIQARKIDTLVTGIAGVDSVINLEAFAGGVEQEPEEVYRKRLLESYIRISNGANLKFYEDLAMSCPNVWSAKAIFHTTSHQLQLYISDMFRMTPDSLCQQVKQVIEENRELNIDVVVKKPEIIVQNLVVTVYVESMQNQVAQQGMASTFLEDQLYQMGIGQDINPYSLADSMKEVVTGYREVVFEQPTTLVTIENDQIVMPGTITVKMKRKDG